jgi:hypothetical protein
VIREKYNSYIEVIEIACVVLEWDLGIVFRVGIVFFFLKKKKKHWDSVLKLALFWIFLISLEVVIINESINFDGIFGLIF